MSEWISVEERLPGDTEEVLVWWPSQFPGDFGEKPRALVAQYGFAGWRSDPSLFGTIADSERGDNGPELWMPLPVPEMKEQP